jgi:acyl dehydratase
LAIDPSFIGRVYPPTAVYEVGREKIREFADSIGDTNPVFRDPAAARALGYPDIIAPPTFPIVLTLPAGRQATHDPEIGIDYGRVVHGEQRFIAARPIAAGDQLQVIVSIDSIRVAAGNDMLTVRADVVTIEGEQVVTAYGLLVVRAPDPVSAG